MPQLGFRASSGLAWQLWLARRSQKEAVPLDAQPVPRVLELAASKAADFTAFDHVGLALRQGAGYAAGGTFNSGIPNPNSGYTLILILTLTLTLTLTLPQASCCSARRLPACASCAPGTPTEI